MTRSKEKFPEFLDAIGKGYNADFINMLPKAEEFPDEIFENGNLDLGLLEKFISTGAPGIMQSVSKRIIAICKIQESRDQGTKLDVDATWSLIKDSISCIPKDYTISSIGSQGFLSIPLYKSDEVKNEFDFIRLHIWDDSLNQYMDLEKCEQFSIHTHTFYAKSWTITGNVVNNRYSVQSDDSEGEHSLFTVEYNASLNHVNKHNSKAVNTGKHVKVEILTQELHPRGNSYQINAGDFHKSGHQNNGGVSATFFSFTAKDGLVKDSYVVGPKQISESLINRKMSIDPSDLIGKIQGQLRNNI